MRNSINQLKPKANKLLAYITNWQLAKPEKNQELSKSLSKLIDTGTFPSPIRSFFQLPQFNKLLNTMAEHGKLFILKKQESVDEDGAHPPMEIQKLQILIEAFHKLVHLDYNGQKIKHPNVYAKVLADNILEYLGAVDMFAPFEGRIVEEILTYLFKSLRKQSLRLKEVITKNPNDFSYSLFELKNSPIMQTLIHIDRKTYNQEILESWHPILVELNIDPKLAHLSKNLKDIASANAHKLLNQMKTLLDEKRQFYQRNVPRFVPGRLKADVLAKLEDVPVEKMKGQRVNELFYDEFMNQRYEVIEARQLGIHHKSLAYAEKLWPVKKSLTSLIDQYEAHLPKHFSDYFNDKIRLVSSLLSILGKPNHLAVQLTCGFYSTQLDYLSELLTMERVDDSSMDFEEEIDLLLPLLLSFFELYYAHKPKASFKTIRSILENIFPKEEAFLDYSLDEVKQRIDETFSHLLPLENSSFQALESLLMKISQLVEKMIKKAADGSIERRLLSQVFQEMLLLDLPSFSESWHTFGSLMSVFFILLSKKPHFFEKTIEMWQVQLEKSTFFQVMFYQS